MLRWEKYVVFVFKWYKNIVKIRVYMNDVYSGWYNLLIWLIKKYIFGYIFEGFFRLGLLIKEIIILMWVVIFYGMGFKLKRRK